MGATRREGVKSEGRDEEQKGGVFVLAKNLEERRESSSRRDKTHHK